MDDVTDCTPAAGTGTAIAERRAEPDSMLALIARAATDPAVDVAKMEALLKMQRELQAEEARAEFNAAYARLAPRMPRIKKNGAIEFGDGKGKTGGRIPFARWEDIDAAIRPLLAEEGFGLSFFTAPRPGDGGGLVVTARLRHANGHFEETAFPVPLDTGPGRNNLQAYGSSLSYGRRYAACAILNIVTEGVDDDGVAGGKQYISADQLREIDELRRTLGVDLESLCRTLAVESLVDLEQAAYPVALNLLHARKRRQKGGPA